jgi:dethiobiotin synthetase
MFSENLKIFVTGIGTDVGKTIASSILTESLKADYWKPIQAGLSDGKTDLETVKQLVLNSKTTFHESTYNLTSPLSPHWAAKIDGVEINVKKIKLPITNNHLVIEGAGGVFVPINEENVIADLIDENYTVILVSKNYLGSINHTLLSIFYLKSIGIKKLGVLFCGEENIESQRIIEKLGRVKIIGRINQIEVLTKENITIEAEKIKSNLLHFLT